MAYQGGEESCRPNKTIIAHWYSLSMIILSSLFAAGWRVSAGVGGWKVENLGKIGLYGRRKAERQAMDQLNVSITDRLAGYVRNKVKSGRYNNASEVVREALRRMGDEDARRTAGKAQRGGHPNGPGGRGAGAAETSQESKGDAVEACHSPVVARGALPRACGGLRAKRFGANRRPGR